MDLRTVNVCPRCGRRIVRPHEAQWKHRDKTACTWPAAEVVALAPPLPLEEAA